MMTRRNFVGALAAVAAAGGSGLATILARRPRWSVAAVDVRTAPALKGRNGVLKSATGETLNAVVTEVTAVRRRGGVRAPDTEQISLLVRAVDAKAPGGTYRIEGRDFVLDPLYLSPVGREGRDRRLEAVINRIV